MARTAAFVRHQIQGERYQHASRLRRAPSLGAYFRHGGLSAAACRARIRPQPLVHFGPRQAHRPFMLISVFVPGLTVAAHLFVTESVVPARTESCNAWQAIDTDGAAPQRTEDPTDLPPTRIGPVIVSGERSGFIASVRLESVAIDMDGRNSGTVGIRSGEVNVTSLLASYGIAEVNSTLDALLGTASVSESDNREYEGSGFQIGARGNWSKSIFDRWTFGSEFSLLLANCDVDSDAAPEAQLRWAQVDARAAVAWMPSPDAVFALSPYGGLGLRFLDGLQEDGQGNYLGEFDGDGFYVFLGANALWRPSDQYAACVDLGLNLGAVQGLSLSLLLSH